MKIGIVSDTHLSGGGRKLPHALIEGLRDCDAILHAGDWVAMDVYEELSRLAPVYGVAGNGDGEELIRRFGMKRTVEFGGVRIGIVHGHEGTGRTTPERALLAFRDDPQHLIVFGHSHIPLSERRGETLLFNPGSPTDKRRQPNYSFGLVMIHGGSLHAEHRYYSDKN
jgi:putative phosphoesterase